MADLDPLLFPADALKHVKPWNPGTLVDRGPGAERRAANQPGRRGGDPEAEAAEAKRRAARAAREQQLAQMRQAARQEGFDAGYGEGKALVDAHIAQFQALLAGVQGATARFEETLATEVLDLALEVARQVLRSELATHPEAILPIVQEALRAVPEGAANGEIQLHPDDVALVRERIADEIRLGAWRVIAEPSIERGGCRIITRQCDVDATLVSRWRRVVQMLGREDEWEAGAE